MDKASDYGSEDCQFDSDRGYYTSVQIPVAMCAAYIESYQQARAVFSAARIDLAAFLVHLVAANVFGAHATCNRHGY